MITNTMKAIEKTYKMKIPSKYDIYLGNVDDIMENSSCMQIAILNAFRFGYLQGTKAEKKKVHYE